MTNRELLYIEDNFHNRRIVRKILERQGYTLHEAEDGLSGFEMLKEQTPPVVLLDISLPGMDGIEIAQAVKADPALRHIYLIALTASAMSGDKERFLAAGCDDYLSKPFRAMDLVEVVTHYLDLAAEENASRKTGPADLAAAELSSRQPARKPQMEEPQAAAAPRPVEQRPAAETQASPAAKPKSNGVHNLPPKRIDKMIKSGISGLINPDIINPENPNNSEDE